MWCHVHDRVTFVIVHLRLWPAFEDFSRVFGKHAGAHPLVAEVAIFAREVSKKGSERDGDCE